jgi:cytoskeletal protein CcmA (bactofilin family)
MRFGTVSAFSGILGVILSGSMAAQSRCTVDEVLVKGRVDHAAIHAKVRVQLMYAKGLAGESGEATIDNGAFTIAIEFLTQSRRPRVNGILEKCSRRPSSVIVTLLEGDGEHEDDRVTLDFAKDFRMADPSAYSLRSELVLNRPR